MTESITIEEYTLSHDNGLNFKCTRNGEPWRDLIGDNLVFAMFSEIQECREYIEILEKVRGYK